LIVKVSTLILLWMLLGDQEQAPTLIYLVRHAEKQSEARDPELSELGRQRVDALTRLLQRIDFDWVIASEFRRTQMTVQPTADRCGVPLTVIPAEREGDLVSKITQKRGQTVLIAGHSNTVPSIMQRLGCPSEAIDHDQYDDLYLVIWQGSVCSIQHFQLTRW